MLSCSCSFSYSCPEAMLFYFGFGARAKERVRNTQSDMEKPNARGPTPSRKAHLALGEKLNRKEKPPPQMPARTRKNRPTAPPRNRRVDRQILCTSICQPSLQKLQRRYQPGPSTLSPSLRNSESCEECLKQRLKILLQVTAGASCHASADARSNFIMTRSGVLSRSCSRDRR